MASCPLCWAAAFTARPKAADEQTSRPSRPFQAGPVPPVRHRPVPASAGHRVASQGQAPGWTASMSSQVTHPSLGRNVGQLARLPMRQVLGEQRAAGVPVGGHQPAVEPGGGVGSEHLRRNQREQVRSGRRPFNAGLSFGFRSSITSTLRASWLRSTSYRTAWIRRTGPSPRKGPRTRCRRRSSRRPWSLPPAGRPSRRRFAGGAGSGPARRDASRDGAGRSAAREVDLEEQLRVAAERVAQLSAPSNGGDVPEARLSSAVRAVFGSGAWKTLSRAVATEPLVLLDLQPAGGRDLRSPKRRCRCR